MLTSKQRARLRAMANTLNDTVLIGKEGITDAVLAQAEEVLETAMMTPREAQGILCEALDAEPVQCIGTKAVIFRVAREPDNRHINPNP